jgi:hypothetical protein
VPVVPVRIDRLRNWRRVIEAMNFEISALFVAQLVEGTAGVVLCHGSRWSNFSCR